MSKIGEAIRQARRNKGYSIQRLSNRTRVAPNSISNWERGLVDPSVTKLIALADALDVTLDALVGRKFAKWGEAEWKMVYQNNVAMVYECSSCCGLSIGCSDYCPNCGAKMKGGAE